MGLHYGEGDKVPLSHVYATFQTMYEFSQNLKDFEVITDFLEDEEPDEVTGLVRERWLGTQGGKVGLKADVHLLAFAIDPYVQAAMTTPETVTCDLMDGHVTGAARRALRHFSKDDAQKRAILEEQLGLWMAATPARKPDEAGEAAAQLAPAAATTNTTNAYTSKAVQSGNNAFSSLRHAAMETTWEKIRTAEDKRGVQAISPEDAPAAAMGSTLSRLKQCSSPVTFWLTMLQETPRGANGPELEAHRMFCRSMSDISAIVGHTCGVERAGKAYGLVMSSLRKSMDPVRAIKSVYVYANYPLLNFKHELGHGYDAFAAMMSNQADGHDGDGENGGVINHDGVTSPRLRRGRLITEDTRSSDESESDDGDEGGTGGDKPDPVAWSMPDKFTLGPEPSKLDSKLIGSYIYMRWKDYGWQLGKVYEQITRANPRLFKKFNYRVVWADNSKGPSSLRVENYAHGPDAALDSWVVLLRKEGAADE